MLRFCLFVSFFLFPLMDKAKWYGNPVCWWLGLYFCSVCCSDEASCTGYYSWLGDAGPCIQVVSFVWVLTIWYSHGRRSLIGCSSWGRLGVGHNWATSLSLFTFMHWRRKCNPLQCSCLENPRDGGAWWAAVFGVAESRTQLKWLSSSNSRVSSLVV